MSSRIAPLAAAACAAAACVVAIAYGPHDTAGAPPAGALAAPAVPGGSSNPNTVTEADVEAAGAGTPERALLAWFRAVQAEDVAAVRALTAPRALIALGPGELEADVRAVAPSLAKPRIVSTRVRGRRAELRVLLLSYAAGNPEPVLQVPATLALTRAAGRWRLGDLSLLHVSAREVRRALGSS